MGCCFSKPAIWGEVRPSEKNKKSRQVIVLDGQDRLATEECFCACRFNVLSSEEEYGTTVARDVRRQVQDAINQALSTRRSPRSISQKIQYGMALCCCDILPTFCCPPCPSEIIPKIALMHIRYPTYEFVRFGSKVGQDDGGDYRLHLFTGSTLFARISARRYEAFLPNLRCFYARSELGRVACVYATGFSLGTAPPLTLLYSHNNGADLGICLGYIVRVARRFGVAILAYDYCGFGQSHGSCSENGVYKSAEAAYDFLTGVLRAPPEQIVAIGSSLGCAATIHIATTRKVKGVVLRGAFMSAFRVVCPFECSVSCVDQFLNIDRIGGVHVPTLFVHGQNDEYFRIKHAKLLREACPGAADIEPHYIEDCHHMDFDEKPSYWKRLHQFLHVELTRLPEMSACCSHRILEWYWNERAALNALLLASKPPARNRDPIMLCEECLTGTIFRRPTVEEIEKNLRAQLMATGTLPSNALLENAIQKPTTHTEMIHRSHSNPAIQKPLAITGPVTATPAVGNSKRKQSYGAAIGNPSSKNSTRKS